MTPPLLFSTAAHDYLGRALAAEAGWELGAIARKTFPDGEHYLRLDSDPADRDVVLVGGTIDDATTLELYDLACALVTAGAYRLRLVIPFFGYGTMERSVRAGEVVTAKTRARLLSSIPMASRGTQVFLLDLHVAAIAHYFEGGIRPIHVYGKAFVIAAARALGGASFVLACTDAGRAKWVESLANDMDVAAAFVYKRRHDGADITPHRPSAALTAPAEPGPSVEVTGVSAQVEGKRVVIYDDMIRTGGSLINAAQAYKDAGAASIDAIATHGLFPGDSLARLEATGLFGTIVTTDSHPRAVALAAASRSGFLQVRSTVPLLLAHLSSNR